MPPREQVGSAHIKITAEGGPEVRREVDKTGSSLENLGGKMDQTTAGARKFSGALTGLTGIYTGLIGVGALLIGSLRSISGLFVRSTESADNYGSSLERLSSQYARLTSRQQALQAAQDAFRRDFEELTRSDLPDASRRIAELRGELDRVTDAINNTFDTREAQKVQAFFDRAVSGAETFVDSFREVSESDALGARAAQQINALERALLAARSRGNQEQTKILLKQIERVKRAELDARKEIASERRKEIQDSIRDQIEGIASIGRAASEQLRRNERERLASLQKIADREADLARRSADSNLARLPVAIGALGGVIQQSAPRRRRRG